MSQLAELAGKVAELAQLMHDAFARTFAVQQEHGTELDLLKASLVRLEKENEALRARMTTIERTSKARGF